MGEYIRDQLAFSRVNGGFPYPVVKVGDYSRNGEIYLLHRFEGIKLDLKYVERTLPYDYRLWGKNVYLETFVEGKPMLFTYDGNKVSRKFM